MTELALLPGDARGQDALRAPPRAEPIRRRTLFLLRWIAIGGQLAAVAAAWAMGVRFPLLPVLVLIAVGATVNTWLMGRTPRPVSPHHAVLQLSFDLAQIAGLIALTGGLSNPFALLLLAPVTVASTVLDPRRTVILGIGAAVLITLAAWWAVPLSHVSGQVLRLPPLMALGHWLAILIGLGFFAAYAHRVTTELADTTNALFATQMALAREHRLQHLGGVVAAAAHEMGTPLGTIKLIAAELADELDDSRPDLRADLAELTASADRCGAILRSMGKAGKDDLILRAAPVQTVIAEAAAPHAERGVRLRIEGDDPDIRRDPGVIHGLRNLIQNAVDHAAEEVRITVTADPQELRLTIRDDGPGFPPAILPRLGEPHPPGRGPLPPRKREAGMGLGLFIAKTLLERSGAVIVFGNGGPGAVVSLRWPGGRITADSRRALGANPAFDA